MATIVVLEHLTQQGLGWPYFVYALAEYWRADGHRVLVHHGIGQPPGGDVAILHLDTTIVPDEYRAHLARFPRVVNGAVLDISKRRVSRNLLARGDDWNGPVLVKTDANHGGHSDTVMRIRAAKVGVPIDIPTTPELEKYPVFAAPRDVPERYWSEPGLVVEKFQPERDFRGFYLREWMFFGDRERCQRFRALVPIIKVKDCLAGEPIPVPDEIRAERARLGFDYGKFDFVLHEGRPVLLDANRSPTLGPPEFEPDIDVVAQGLRAFLR